MRPKSALLLAFAACQLSAGVYATENVAGDLQEVIVTAQFRETELMKSSGNIPVVQQETLFDRGAQHLGAILPTRTILATVSIL